MGRPSIIVADNELAGYPPGTGRRDKALSLAQFAGPEDNGIGVVLLTDPEVDVATEALLLHVVMIKGVAREGGPEYLGAYLGRIVVSIILKAGWLVPSV